MAPGRDHRQRHPPRLRVLGRVHEGPAHRRGRRDRRQRDDPAVRAHRRPLGDRLGRGGNQGYSAGLGGCRQSRAV